MFKIATAQRLTLILFAASALRAVAADPPAPNFFQQLLKAGEFCQLELLGIPNTFRFSRFLEPGKLTHAEGERMLDGFTEAARWSLLAAMSERVKDRFFWQGIAAQSWLPSAMTDFAHWRRGKHHDVGTAASWIGAILSRQTHFPAGSYKEHLLLDGIKGLVFLAGSSETEGPKGLKLSASERAMATVALMRVLNNPIIEAALPEELGAPAHQIIHFHLQKEAPGAPELPEGYSNPIAAMASVRRRQHRDYVTTLIPPSEHWPAEARFTRARHLESHYLKSTSSRFYELNHTVRSSSFGDIAVMLDDSADALSHPSKILFSLNPDVDETYQEFQARQTAFFREVGMRYPTLLSGIHRAKPLTSEKFYFVFPRDQVDVSIVPNRWVRENRHVLRVPVSQAGTLYDFRETGFEHREDAALHGEFFTFLRNL